jgi:hypothetical protein
MVTSLNKVGYFSSVQLSRRKFKKSKLYARSKNDEADNSSWRAQTYGTASTAIFTDSACRQTRHKARRSAKIARKEAWNCMVTNQGKEADSAADGDSKPQQPVKPAAPPPLKIPPRQTIIKPR